MVMNVGIRANQMLIWGFKFDMHIFITTSIKWGERTLRNLFSSFLITCKYKSKFQLDKRKKKKMDTQCRQLDKMANHIFT